jgi:hypothetical protein
MHSQVEPTEVRAKRRPEMISGLIVSLAPMKADFGAAEVQMVCGQVLGPLNSYLSNHQNDFVSSVYGSTVSNEVRHARNTRLPGSLADPRETNPHLRKFVLEMRFLRCEAQTQLGKVSCVGLTT